MTERSGERTVGGAIVGTDGANLLLGTGGPDVIVARDGNDVVLAFGGDDLICGGLGDDRIVAQDGSDTIAADDLGFFGDPQAPGGNVDGGPGADFLPLARGDDLGSGGAGDDMPNFDRCIGSTGTDTALLCERTVGVE